MTSIVRRSKLPALTLFISAALAACPKDPVRLPNLPPPEYETPRPFPGATSSATATTSGVPEEASVSADETFAAIGKQYLEDYFVHQPVRATEAGDHRFDARWPDVSEKGDAAYRKMVVDTAAKVAAVDVTKLNVENAIDRGVLQNQLELSLFALDESKPAVTDPMFYTALIGDGIDPLVSREFGTPASRIKSLIGRLNGVGALVKAAKARLQNPAELRTKTAIAQNKGLIDLTKTGFDALIKVAGSDAENLKNAAKAAEFELTDFQKFLEDDLAKRSKGEVRLGKDKFKKKLGLVLDDSVDADALVAAARASLAATRAEMYATSKALWSELFPKKPWKDAAKPEDEAKIIKTVLDELAKDVSTNKTIVKDAEATLTLATEFVKKHDLVRVPTEPCSIVEMPEYRRGVAIAYCDSSGPLEEKPQTFYAISPTPKDWPKKRVDSFYREYNRSMLHDLTVHEAMPGHFLQVMHQNKFSSKLRAVLSHGAFVEGWAVYTEWLMAKYGFGGDRVKMQRLKMALRMAANTILDHGVHSANMSEKDAIKMMTEEAFQEEGEAVGKWKRAQLTSAQLSTYFYGFTKMMDLRKTAEAKPGFKERTYHDELLAHGSPAPRYLPMLFGK